jgi:hypothetical protein
MPVLKDPVRAKGVFLDFSWGLYFTLLCRKLLNFNNINQTDAQKNHMAAVDIEELIPHRGRMKLIASILEVSVDSAVTSAIVSDACVPVSP